uniref:Uncharacterized protein n=1 Tax=Anguilla anguilla TaxID=7936 RepID=A0A0E9V429_ANGAN
MTVSPARTDLSSSTLFAVCSGVPLTVPSVPISRNRPCLLFSV